MTELPKYHLSEQQGDALLGPILATLRELEHRAAHYLERLTLADADVEALRAAREALASARDEVERLYRDSAARARA